MSNNDLISREWLEDAFDNLCCHNCKTCRNFRIEDSFYKCALIDNAPIVEMPGKQRIRIRVKFYIAKLFVYLAKYRILTPILCLYLKHNGFEV